MSVRSRILGPPVPKMPFGLIELMDGLARDVLKNNPENIYEFCAQHMHTLLAIRDGRAPKPLLTVEEKITIAQKKVRQRAEQRQREYDKLYSNINEELSVNVSQNGEVSEKSVKSDLKNIPSAVKAEVKEKVSVDFADNDIETSESETILNTVTEDKEHENNSENLIVPDSQSNDKCDTIIDDHDARHFIEAADVNNSIGNSKEVLSITNTVEANNCNVKESLQDELVTRIEDTYKIEENIDLQDVTKNQNELKTQMHQSCDAKINSTDAVEKIDESPQIDAHMAINPEQLEKQIEDPQNTELNSNNDTKDDSHVAINTEQIDTSSNSELNSSNETKDDSVENHQDNLNTIDESILDKTVAIANDKAELISMEDTKPYTTEPVEIHQVQTSQQATESVGNKEDTNGLVEKHLEQSNVIDESIMHETVASVIVNVEKAEPIFSENIETLPSEADHDQNSQLDTVENKEVDRKTDENLDSDSAPEPMHDKTNNMNSSMDLETAAITIQKVFRSFLFKSKTASYDDPTTVDMNMLTQDKEKEEDEIINVKDRRSLGISRMDTVLQTVNEEKSLSLSTDDSSTLSSAATIIQAHVRGFLVRNKTNLNKTISSNSLMDSEAPSIPSLEADSDNRKSKTVLNIHIVPEGGHFVSRDESILTSTDLSLDSSPPSSVNLHPLGYDKSERRKQLKREDAIQSVSPPSNNSGKLSEEHDSVKEVLSVDNTVAQTIEKESAQPQDILTRTEVKKSNSDNENPSKVDGASDEMDVITPFVDSSRESDTSSKLLHSGEFHDIVIPTSVTRSDTSVVRGE